jgi:Translation initiation factor IF-2, N-terminal region
MKIRISQLAGELRCKANEILEALPGLGITRPSKITHNTSIGVAEAEIVRAHFVSNPDLAEPKTDAKTLGFAKSIAARFGEEI